MLQDVQKDYKSKKWILQDEKPLQFQEVADDSSAISLNVTEPKSADDKWLIEATRTPKVKTFSSQID